MRGTSKRKIMSKIFVSNWISLDGIFSGPGGDTGWFTSDDDLYRYNIEQLLKADTIIFGRTTYELMLNYWPTQQAKHDYPHAYAYMNGCKKHTFSKTVSYTDWQSCFFYKELNRAAIEDIKRTTHKDIVVLGSGEISKQLHNLGLIDEYHILLDPQIKGQGKQFFHETDPVRLKLDSTKKFDCGVTYLQYSVVK